MEAQAPTCDQYQEKARALLPGVRITYQGEEHGVYTFQVSRGSTTYAPAYDASDGSWRCTCREFRTHIGTCTHVELVKLWRAEHSANGGSNGHVAPPPPPTAKENGAPPPRPVAREPADRPVSQPTAAADGTAPSSAFPTPAAPVSSWSVAIAERLLEPFPAAMVGWKAQATTKDGNRAMAVAYVDARAVMDRLDEAVGPDGWQDSYTLLSQEGTPFGNEVVVACHLSVLGVTKCDVGVGEDAKSAYSDAFKRAAVKFGISRYLYSLDKQWVAFDPQRKQLKETPTLPPWAVPGGR